MEHAFDLMSTSKFCEFISRRLFKVVSGLNYEEINAMNIETLKIIPTSQNEAEEVQGYIIEHVLEATDADGTQTLDNLIQSEMKRVINLPFIQKYLNDSWNGIDRV